MEVFKNRLDGALSNPIYCKGHWDLTILKVPSNLSQDCDSIFLLLSNGMWNLN